jgi:hypothetical protein
MAYMSQENKKSKEPLIKAILKKYGVKGSVSVKHYSTLVVTIKSGRIDFIGDYNATGKGTRSALDGHIQVNPHWCHEHFTGEAKDCLKELRDVMDSGNHNNSEPQIDHFDVGWYVDINIGQWDKPYMKED